MATSKCSILPYKINLSSKAAVKMVLKLDFRSSRRLWLSTDETVDVLHPAHY